MHDTDRVGGSETFRQLDAEIDDFLCGHRSTEQALAQVFTLDEFHDEEAGVMGCFESVDAGDAGVLQRGQGAGFAVEAGQPLRIPGHFGGENLDGDVPAELGVAGAVHLAHAAFAEGGGDFVVGKGFADQDGLRKFGENRS